MPDQAARERVLAYVEEHADRFRTGGPEIRILRNKTSHEKTDG